MCQKCVDAARRYFPRVRKRDMGELLISCTSYPMGCGDDIARQLRNLSRRKACNGTLHSAMVIAEADMQRYWQRLKPHLQPNA